MCVCVCVCVCVKGGGSSFFGKLETLVTGNPVKRPTEPHHGRASPRVVVVVALWVVGNGPNPGNLAAKP